VADRRAVRDFSVTADPWPVIQQWASEHNYIPVEQAPDVVSFKKGIGFWVAPRHVSIANRQGAVHLEAWVSAGFFMRLMSLFILPPEITIASGGMKAVVPRKMAKADVNKLLERLGQAPIE
jgi:hypothetical protein